MDLSGVIPIAVTILLVLIAFIATVVAINKFYVKVEQGVAMIVNTMRQEPEVTFTGRFVWPVVHKKEFMDISLKTIEISRKGTDGLICKDNIRADIVVAFFVRVNKNANDVLKVAERIGCNRASDQTTLEEMFSAKFSEALKTVGKQMDFEDLYRERAQFREQIIEQLSPPDNDLGGYDLSDVAIDYIEQTPITQLDDHNILDAQGIRKITELTAQQHVRTNELQREEEMQIKKKDVEAKEMILELERQQADAEAKQQREISSVKAREQAEIDKVQAEEQLKAERARIETSQEIEVQEQNKQREVEVAEKNRERALAIETEKVERVRQLEVISREKEVELQRIAKEKALEEERKAIADVVRERIAVDRTVAEEEEQIKTLRVVAEADRQKQVTVTDAEAEAEQALVKQIKASEAAEQCAQHEAKQKLTLAQAKLEISEKEAQAKIRLADGVKAEIAAPGIAQAEVEEAKALALEKTGLAEASVLKEKMQAEAQGTEQVGLAEAKVTAEKMASEAKGQEMQGMAEVRIKDADALSEEKQALVQVKVKVAEAEAIEKQGNAEAESIRQRFKAEADGLREKFDAMASMSDVARDHEEFRMKLDTSHAEKMAEIDISKDIAAYQAQVLSEAMKQAKIDIVGGGGDYFDSFVKSLSVGKAIDGAVEKSSTIQQVAGILTHFLANATNKKDTEAAKKLLETAKEKLQPGDES
ncbi:hypothetical protein H0A36_20320 [Endozoicomonas sp. SM1973]|uniref:Band 7 domain-containing protein n=1 Tax=Spartinivicinus marinus TaxID=2994442 RepID=A0A853IFU6_9GAMM|nr:hypothetical protein [Spartinivicinus marinus]MCX4028008.1 hypothetical protein [Spartinivicinus marinus]NYZ68367.1 hypothetical protein [Spartinivicinus marinus]